MKIKLENIELNYRTTSFLKLSFLVILLQFLSLNILAQDKKVVVSSQDGSTLFINFPNEIELGFQGFCGDEKDVEFICEDCDSIVNSEEYKYYIYSHKRGSLQLEFYLTNENNDSSIFISQAWFNVKHLPDPDIMMGSYFSSESVNLSKVVHKVFFANYPPSNALEARFSVNSWVVKTGDKVFKGDNPQFSEKLKQFLFEENHSEKFEMGVCLSIGSPDGTTREICDVFTIEP